MPIKIDIHDNTSQVKVIPRCNNSNIPVETSGDIDYRSLEALLSKEIMDRILGDANLQAQIDIIIERSGAKYLLINENSNNGSISISLLDQDEKVLDTKLITLTEKIIKSANVDYDNNKINYICNNGSIIELDISEIIDRITAALGDISEIKTDINKINNKISIINNDISGINLTLSQHSSAISVLQNTVNDHTLQLSTINSNISGINSQLSTLNNTVESHGRRLTILERDMYGVTLSIAALENSKVDKDFETAHYEHIDPSSLSADKLEELLVYISKNGVPNYAKLSELGFARIRDYDNASGMSEVAEGDLLIDME